VTAPRVVVLGSSDQVLQTLARAAEALAATRSRGLSFEHIQGDVQPAVARVREREPHALIGYVASDEPSVLAALAGGADEAAAKCARTPCSCAARSRAPRS